MYVDGFDVGVAVNGAGVLVNGIARCVVVAYNGNGICYDVIASYNATVVVDGVCAYCVVVCVVTRWSSLLSLCVVVIGVDGVASIVIIRSDVVDIVAHVAGVDVGMCGAGVAVVVGVVVVVIVDGYRDVVGDGVCVTVVSIAVGYGVLCVEGGVDSVVVAYVAGVGGVVADGIGDDDVAVGVVSVTPSPNNNTPIYGDIHNGKTTTTP